MTELKRMPRVDRGNGKFAWFLAGEGGVVQFVAGPMDLPADWPYGVKVDGRTWYGVDVGHHSPRPLYEGETPMDTCDLLDGVTCYYDGSGLAAERLLKAWAAADCNDEVIWAELAECYDAWFGGGAR